MPTSGASWLASNKSSKTVAIERDSIIPGFVVITGEDGLLPNQVTFSSDRWDDCQIIHDAYVRVGYRSLVSHEE